MKVTVFSSSSLNTTLSGFVSGFTPHPNISPPQDGKFHEGYQGCPFVWEDNRGTFGHVFHPPDIVVEDVGIFRY